jgi:NADH:ubiquinone oxidoreductase 17.2 kD subunit|tara:strand:+ start:1023 stop:1382 length:360 start_codon:yes stop_codon:yes gene_type:complete
MIKQIFTWWNSQTVGTFIYTIFFGKLVGKDEFGNKYYKNEKKRKRWVIYNGEVNASKITSDWYSWIHYTTNETPSEKKYKKHSWQKPHAENKTGTKESYRPNKISKKNKEFKKYETWQP